MPEPYPGLQLDEHMPFQRLEWRLERIGWSVLLLVIIAATAGLLGPGPLSHSLAETLDQTVEIHHQRFGRFQSPQSLTVRFRAAAGASHDIQQPGQAVTVWISNSLLEMWSVEQVFPEPLETAFEADGILYRFKKVNAADHDIPATIELQVRPRRAGHVSGRIGAAPDNAVDIWQIVYP